MAVKKSTKLILGDLAKHTMKYSDTTEAILEKIGLVVSINPVMGSGFQSADIIWCNSGHRETVMMQYLKTIQSI